MTLSTMTTFFVLETNWKPRENRRRKEKEVQSAPVRQSLCQDLRAWGVGLGLGGGQGRLGWLGKGFMQPVSWHPIASIPLPPAQHTSYKSIICLDFTAQNFCGFCYNFIQIISYTTLPLLIWWSVPSYLNPTLSTTLATTKVSDSKVDVCIIPSDQICRGSAGYLSKFLRHPWSFEAKTTPGVWPFDCDHSRHCLPTSESSSSSSEPSSSSSSPACQNHQNQL